ncbi:MAG: AmmeMemoRadiSam system protein B [Acidobacteriota bacterium]
MSILVRDPLEIGEQAVAVSPEFYWLMLRLDGSRTLFQLQQEFSSRVGQQIEREQMLVLLQQLDALLFLDNARFRERYRQSLSQFRSRKVRPSKLAGLSYPADAVETSRMLSSLYVAPDGAGLAATPTRREVRALVAPHIDLRLGGPTYTHAYRFLRESILPERFVILGIGHMGLPQYYSISRKDFETPLGTACCDREFLHALDGLLGAGTFGEDLTHRTEHSIEFQVLFLQHLYEDRKFWIVPILTSFSYHDLLAGPDCERMTRLLVDALRGAEEACPKRTCYLASVDLAHLGPRYGDPHAPDASAIAEALARDRILLEAVARGDSARFVEGIEAERDRRHVCGFSALYALLQLNPGMHGQILAHSHCQMDETGSVVTYASLAFTA